MFIGHSLLAFAVVAVVARASAVDRQRALTLGAVAGAFAAVPDADMAYAVSGVVGVGDDGVFALTNAFWAASTVVHRSMTHSVVVAPVAAAGFALFAHHGRYERQAAAVGALVLAGLAAVATAQHGALGLFVIGTFVGVGVGVALVVRAYTDLTASATFVLALFGMASHPWGDLFTGEPPALFWPFETTVFADRLALAADPTLHLLGAFAVELAVVAVALLVFARLTERRVRVDRRSVAGVAYGIAVLAIPAPTLDVSYPFVFSILSVGVLATLPGLYRARVPAVSTDGGEDEGPSVALDGDRALSALASGVAAVAVALVAYGVGYWLVG